MKNLVFSMILIISFIVPVAALAGARPPAKWTVMVFVNGHNIFDAILEKDVNEMKKAGSSRDVNVLALFDRERKPAELLLIKKGGAEVLKSYAKYDSGNCDNLIEFVRFAHENYPAEKYMLVVCRHGQAWYFGGRGDKWARYGRIIYDEGTPYSAAYSPGFAMALKGIKDVIGRPLDVLGLDIDMMQRFENCLEFKDNVKYIVASEETETHNGWKYDAILKSLTETPDMSPETLAAAIVESYYESYRQGAESVTISALDCSRTDEVLKKLEAFSVELINSLSDPIINACVNAAANGVQTYADDDFCDLAHFCSLLENELNDRKMAGGVIEKSRELREAVSKIVIANRFVQSSVKFSHGISIYLPKYRADKRYSDLKMSRTKWFEFLKAFRK